jgi:acetolactate synthase-1/3 small subunit
MRHTISVLVENKFGVLARVAGLFSGRGYNIESLCVAPTMDPSVSQMTIVTGGDDRVIEQVTKQLNKLIDVIKVIDMHERDYIDREMMLVRVSAEKDKRDEILRIADIFKSRVVDVGLKTLTLEVTGTEDKIDAVLRILRPLGIRELIRTGKVAMLRSEARSQNGGTPKG